MPDFEILTPGEFVRRIGETVSSMHRPSTYSSFQFAPTPVAPAPFALIVGAGFSCNVVPLVKELMHETIGDYVFPDQDQSSMERPAGALRKHSATVWPEVNTAARRRGASGAALDGKGLPYDPGAAYRALFDIDDARVVFARVQQPRSRSSFLEQLTAQRAARAAVEKSETTPREDGVTFVRNAAALRDYLKSRDIIAIGYSGWEDGLMTALEECKDSNRVIYWCDVKAMPNDAVAEFLQSRGKNAKYVSLGDKGADGQMSLLYRELVPPAPSRRDPRQRHNEWRALNRPIG